MSNILVMGDTHGIFSAVDKTLNTTIDMPYDKIVQLGDFGLWTHTFKGVTFLHDVQRRLSSFGRGPMYVVMGNHDNWDHYWYYFNNHPRDEDGFIVVTPHIRFAPRIHQWEWFGKSFLSVAGAVSIDSDLRRQDMQYGSPACWWPDEEITDAEVDTIPTRPVDYMFSHDCSNKTPLGNIEPHRASQIHRQRIDQALYKATPGNHFHGHMHKRYEWDNLTGDDIYTQTYGLDCNGKVDSFGILNTSSDTFCYNLEGFDYE